MKRKCCLRIESIMLCLMNEINLVHEIDSKSNMRNDMCLSEGNIVKS